MPLTGAEALHFDAIRSPSLATHPPTAPRLAQLLKEVPINFSISGDLDNSQATAQQILKYHPETVQLQVLREDFPEVWQAAINVSRRITNSRHSCQLVTGLVVACDTIIQRLISPILGMSSDQLWQLQLQEGAISCIHYPDFEHPPILQAMNVSGSEKDLIFGAVIGGGKNISSFQR